MLVETPTAPVAIHCNEMEMSEQYITTLCLKKKGPNKILEQHEGE